MIKTDDPSHCTIKKKDETNKEIQGRFFDLFRFASIQDYLIFSTGVFLTIINGACASAFALTIGIGVDAFDVRFTEDEVRENAKHAVVLFLIAGVTIFTATFASRTLLKVSSLRQGTKIRHAYFKALLDKDLSFYDQVNPMELSSQIENDCHTIADSLDMKLETVIYSTSAIISAVVVAFIRSWQISVIMCYFLPFIIGSAYLHQYISVKTEIQRSEVHAKAGAIAEEAFENIRTVISLGGEKTEVQRYDNVSRPLQMALSRLTIYQGMIFAFASRTILCVGFGIVFYIGSFYIQDKEINPNTGEPYIAGDVFTPLSVINTSFTLLPNIAIGIKAINAAIVKIKKILDIVDSAETSQHPKKRINNFRGAITFKDVSFSYPLHPDKPVLQNFNLNIAPNTKVALFGESGCGKSTIIQLIQNFYDPTSGSIELDGQDLKTLDNTWIRQNVAYVGQEPVLFSKTIRENLLLAKEDATEGQLIQALKKANAYDFVMLMKSQLETQLGGAAAAQLSGGQKQRIAIARAILKDAKVLILDEATSALDRFSEEEIQKTLDTISQDRTIIIIAHRLSTIKTVDEILVLDKGQIVERETHQELVKKKGKYFDISSTQMSLHSTNESLEKPQRHQNQIESEDEEDIEEKNIHEETSLIRHEPMNIENKNKYQSKASAWVAIKKLWSFNKENKKYYYLGLIGSIGSAILLVTSNIITCGILGVLLKGDQPDYREEINLWCILMIANGISYLLFYTFQFGFFAKAAESFTQTLRIETFYKFLRMEIGWHDRPQNSPGNLAASLESDTANVGQFTGVPSGLMIQILLGNVLAIIVALIAAWQLALVGMLIVPLVLGIAFKLASNDASAKKLREVPLEKTQTIISETLNNIKTARSLNIENRSLRDYSSTFRELESIEVKSRIIQSLLQGSVSLFLYIELAIMLLLAPSIYFEHQLNLARMFFCVFGLMAVAFLSSQLFFLMSDAGRAMHSTKLLVNYCDQKSQIDIDDSIKCYKGKIQGNIEFRNVRFSYPTRRDNIFTDLNLKIPAGQQIALTGPSGCGKTTIIQLLLRFYDVDSGEILLEDVNIKEYDLRYLRKKIGGVFQEPVLFNGTIEYNLKYANEDITDAEMIEAARKANALNFIEANASSEQEENEVSNPSDFSKISFEGFNRLVGPKGGQLSGGQKQRIAIARAILRKPSVLLLDEATSALDAQSEALVQDALNKASQGVSTICIAHRLSTIKDFDEVIVLKDGGVAERGKFEQLVQQKGYLHGLQENILH